MAIETLKFSEMTAGGDLDPGEKTPGLLSGANALFNNPWTFLAPGTTAERPIPAAAMYYRLRLNTTLEIYEYYDPTIPIWVELSGSGTGTVNPGVANDIAYYAASGQAVSPIAGAANSVLVTNGSEVPSLSTTLPSGLSIPGAIITASTAALLSGSVVAAPVSGNDLVNKTYADSLFSGGVTSLTGTTNQISFSSPTGNITASLPQDIALGSTPTFGGLTLSTIPLGSSSGGTGVNNGSSTLTLAGSLATIGAFASNFTMTGATNVTFPTSGTLLTSAGAVTSLAATANQTTVSAATGAVTTGLASNAILPGTGGITLPQGNTAARAGGAGTIRFNTQSLVFESTIDGVAWAIIDTSASGDVDSITGTANQVIASSPTGNVTLSLPQSIATTSAVQFASVRLSSLGLIDNNNVTMLAFNAVASATAWLTIGNAIAPGAPAFTATGAAANIPIVLDSKGTSGVAVRGITSGVAISTGYIGEQINVSVGFAAATNINTGTSTNLLSFSVPAGNWLACGNISFTASGANLTQVIAWVSTTSATIPDVSERAGFTSVGIAVAQIPTATKIFNFSVATTVYLTGNITLGAGTCTQCGTMQLTRIS